MAYNETPHDAAPNAAIVARARKYANMRDDENASPQERETAADKFQQLMLKHNISVATIEAARNDTSTVATRKREKLAKVGRYRWQRDLMSSVATANFCLLSTPQRWAKDRWVQDGFELF